LPDRHRRRLQEVPGLLDLPAEGRDRRPQAGATARTRAAACQAMKLNRRALLAAGAALALPARAQAWERGLLWRVTADGAPPSHLYGTLHLDDAAAKAFAPTVRTALAGARLFRPELRTDQVSGRTFAAAARLPPGPGLRSLTGDALFERVAALFATQYRLPPQMADRLKPWAAFLQLSQPARAPGETVDAALEALARGYGKPVEPLESVEEQIAAVENIPRGSQLTLLAAQAERHAEAMAGLDELRRLYLAEDLGGIARHQRALADAAGVAVRRAIDDLMEHLLFRRNDRIASVLEPDLKRGGVFVAIGALHLHGERGLPAMLARGGYRVEAPG
jgi:uncharacterized protein YbaP (TraB family)